MPTIRVKEEKRKGKRKGRSKGRKEEAGGKKERGKILKPSILEEKCITVFNEIKSILYIENIKNLFKVYELINGFSKIAGYKTNMYILFVFLYTNNEQSENEIRKQFHTK